MPRFGLIEVGRAGLGNVLFPWARAEVFSKETGARLLAPRWPLLRLGPFLRREPDKRNYYSLFDNTGYVRGIERALVYSCAHRIAEDKVATSNVLSWRPELVQFRGLSDLFTPLIPHQPLIRNRLWAITRAQHRRSGQTYGNAFIAMHVRRGDLTRQGFSEAQLAQVKQYTDLAWFVAMARSARKATKLSELPIVVFTDGSPDEVAPLMAMNNVVLHRRQNAIADLWDLSCAHVLFASGYSTFGMWASFLGGMHTFYAPGKLQQRVRNYASKSLETELSVGDPMPDAVC